ncbi:MAG: ABC transporter permease, partial [Nitrospinota bacterium]|nr:ABC transporter permease [Nitrospinota bacterium]
MQLPSKLSAIFLLGLILCALFAPWVAPYSYETQD